MTDLLAMSGKGLSGSFGKKWGRVLFYPAIFILALLAYTAEIVRANNDEGSDSKFLSRLTRKQEILACMNMDIRLLINSRETTTSPKTGAEDDNSAPVTRLDRAENGGKI